MAVATPTQAITASFSEEGGALKVSIPPQEITLELRMQLDKRLLKKGVAVKWGASGPGTQLVLRLVRMDQGNQLLRYLLPFISPAVLEVEGHMLTPGGPQVVHYVQRAQMGIFGGSAKGMLKACAQQLAAKVAKDMLRALGR